jgi:hypothetical protein
MKSKISDLIKNEKFISELFLTIENLTEDIEYFEDVEIWLDDNLAKQTQYLIQEKLPKFANVNKDAVYETDTLNDIISVIKLNIDTLKNKILSKFDTE